MCLVNYIMCRAYKYNRYERSAVIDGADSDRPVEEAETFDTLTVIWVFCARTRIIQ